ncbi:MAG: Smr/MutS family protein, partial [Acholeplasmatales bacterium]|nr:Smr/MutS family protein [Acholeplasmatales bacterium]
EFQKNKEINTLLTKKSKELDTIKQEALSILENITSGNKLPHEIAKIKNDISKLNPYSVVTNEVQDDTEIEVGDSVYIPSYNHTSKVLKIIKNKYYVEFGIMELILKKEELVKVSAQLEEPKNTLSSIRKVAYGEKTDENIVPYTLLKTNQIDLRGKRYNEVEEILDDAINKAFLSGIHTLRIVHGYGTFAIYKAVNEYIKNSSNIISSRKGGANEGLGGVTIITI